jgi:hypothetical protein
MCGVWGKTANSKTTRAIQVDGWTMKCALATIRAEETRGNEQVRRVCGMTRRYHIVELEKLNYCTADTAGAAA